MKKTLVIVLALALAAVVFVSCSSSGSAPQASVNTSYSRNMSMAAPAAAPSYSARDNVPTGGGMNMAEAPMDMMDDAVKEDAEMGGMGGEMFAAPVTDSRKIITTVDMTMQTIEFETGVEKVNALVAGYGGYLQSSYVEGKSIYDQYGTRSASFTARIPAEKMSAFTSELDSSFNVIRTQSSGQDITDSYFDTKARLESLKSQEERLLKLLDNADELKYMLQVEQELANVRYQIESYYSRLQRMDSQVNMSTANITLLEVAKYEPVETVPLSFGERIARAFGGSFQSFVYSVQDFVIGLIWFLPFLIVIIVIALVIITIARRRWKKKAAVSAGFVPVAAPVKPEKENDGENK